MALPLAPAAYSQTDQAQMRREIERMDAENWKRLKDVDFASTRPVLTDTVTGTRYKLTVVSGTLTVTAL